MVFENIHSFIPSSCLLCRVFGVVSYYVQKLFSEYQGVRYIETAVSSSDGDGRDHGIAASASCQNDACTKVAFKVKNMKCMYCPESSNKAFNAPGAG